MKPLFSGRAKVIILGRPDSFLTTEEEDEVLSTLLDGHLEKTKRLMTAEVAFFTKSEVQRYLDNYLSRRSERLSDVQQRNYDSLISKLPDTEDNILCRPVQLNMFTKIIGECLSSDTVLNRRQLYKKFIYRFVVRESSKPARKPTHGSRVVVSTAHRETFMQAVAWWILNTKKENRFLASEIPLDIVPASIRAGRSTAAAIREAIVGSVIEPVSRAGILGSKARKFYYFPHKSYFEFLVAEYFENSRFTRDIYREFMSNINAEILAFLEEGGAKGVEHLREGLVHNIGNVDPRIIEVCATDKKLRAEVASQAKNNRHVSHIYTHYFYLSAKKIDPSVYLQARLVDSVIVDSMLATYNCIGDALAITGDVNLARVLFLNCFTGIPVLTLRRYVEAGEPLKVYRMDGGALRSAVLSKCFRIDSGLKNILFSIEDLMNFVHSATRGSFYVNLPASEKGIGRLKLPINGVTSALSAEFVPLIKLLIKKRDAQTTILPVEFLGAAMDQLR
jgi:hypothetical protein